MSTFYELLKTHKQIEFIPEYQLPISLRRNKIKYNLISTIEHIIIPKYNSLISTEKSEDQHKETEIELSAKIKRMTRKILEPEGSITQIHNSYHVTNEEILRLYHRKNDVESQYVTTSYLEMLENNGYRPYTLAKELNMLGETIIHTVSKLGLRKRNKYYGKGDWIAPENPRNEKIIKFSFENEAYQLEAKDVIKLYHRNKSHLDLVKESYLVFLENNEYNQTKAASILEITTVHLNRELNHLDLLAKVAKRRAENKKIISH